MAERVGIGVICGVVALALGAGTARAEPTHGVSSAVLVDPGIVSTEFGEVRFSRSPDGRWAVWGSTDRPGGPGGWEIWIARCEGERCAEPSVASVSSPANDFDPFFGPDGRELYFFSNRPGGLGGDDLYVARFEADRGELGPAVNLGPGVNSPGDEWAPTLSGDGLRLLFASDGRGGAGKHDLFVARRTAPEGVDWSGTAPLEGGINTEADEFDAAWLADGQTLVFTRSADASSEPMALFSSRAEGPDLSAYPAGQRLGPEINVDDGWTLGPVRDWSRPDRLYFSSHRAEAGRGKLDIYSIELARGEGLPR